MCEENFFYFESLNCNGEISPEKIYDHNFQFKFRKTLFEKELVNFDFVVGSVSDTFSKLNLKEVSCMPFSKRRKLENNHSRDFLKDSLRRMNRKFHKRKLPSDIQNKIRPVKETTIIPGLDQNSKFLESDLEELFGLLTPKSKIKNIVAPNFKKVNLC